MCNSTTMGKVMDPAKLLTGNSARWADPAGLTKTAVDSASAGTTLYVTAAKNGSNLSPAPILSVPLASLGPSITFTVPDGETSLDLLLVQPTLSGSADRVRLESLGPIVFND